MNRQVLLSLLATASAAAPIGALANVNINSTVGKTATGTEQKPDVWVLKGLTEPTKWHNVDLSNDYVTVEQSASGTVVNELMNMPKGRYTLTFGKFDNAVVTVNGATEISNENGVMVFEVAANDTKVTLTISSKDNVNGFSFGFISFAITCPNLELYTKLNDLLTSAAANISTPADNNNTLKAAAAVLEKRKAEAQTLVDMLPGNDGDIDLATYKKDKLGLFNDPATIVTTVETLMTDIKNHNDKVTAHDHAVANGKLIASWQNNAKTLQGLLKAQKDRIDAIENVADKTWAHEQLDGYIETIQGELTAYNTFLTSLAHYAEETPDPGVLNDPENADYKKVFELFNPLAAALQEDNAGHHTETLPTFLPSDVDAVLTSIANYKQVQTNIAKLGEVYNDGIMKVFNGITGTYSTDQRKVFTALYEAAVAELGKTTRDNATERKPDDDVTYTEALKLMQNLLKKVQADQKKMDDAKAAANAVIEGYQATLDALQAKIDAEDACEEVKDLKNDANNIQQQINDLTAWVAENAKNHSLTFDENGNINNKEYTDATDAITTNLDALSYGLDNAALLGGWLDALQAAVEEIVKAQDTDFPVIGRTPASTDKLYDMYNSIKTAIDQLVADNKTAVGKGQKMEITPDNMVWADNITEFQTNGLALAGAFKDAHDLYKALNQQQIDYQEYYNTVMQIGEQITKLGTVKGFDTSILTPYQTAINGFKTTVGAILTGIKADYDNLEGMAQFETIKEHLKKWQTAGTDYAMATSLNAFAIAVNAGNMAVLNNTYAKYNDAFTAAGADAKFGPTLPDLIKALEYWKRQIDQQQRYNNNAQYQDNIPGYCTEQNKAIAKLLDNMINGVDSQSQPLIGMDDMVQAALDNVKNNQDLTALLGVSPACEQYANEKSTEPAQAGWITEGQALDNEYTALVEEIDKAYKAGKLDADKTQELTEKVNAYNTKVTNWKKAVVANEDTYYAQVAEGKKTAEAIGAALEEIKKNYDSAVELIEALTIGDVTCTTVGDCVTLLNDLNQEVTNIGNAAYDLFKAHESVANDTEGADIMGQYKNVQDNVAAILLSLKTQYEKSVIEQNTQTAKDLLTADFTALDDAYKLAVDTYNAYTFHNDETVDGAILNKDYQAGITDALKDHANIQDYFALIEALKVQVKDLIHASTSTDKDEDPNNDLLTKDDFAKVIADCQNYLAYMENYQKQVVADAVVYANKVYGENWMAANDLVSSAMAAMVGAEIKLEIREAAIAEAKRHIAAAEALMNDNGDKASLWMGNILEELGQVAVDTNAAALTYWQGEYTSASGEIADILEELEAITSTNVDEWITKVKNAQSAASDLNQKAENSQALINDVKELVEELTAQLDIAKQALKDAKAADEKNVANKDAAAAFKTEIEGLWTLYNQMRQDVGTLDLTLEDFTKVNTPAAKAAVENAETTLTQYEATANDDSEIIRAAIEGATSAINGCYNSAYTAEMNNLNAQINQIQLDFNNKKASGTDLETLTKWDNALKVQQEALAGVSDINADGFTYTNAIAVMVEVEKGLDALQTEIGLTTPTHNSATDAADQAFNDAFTPVDTALSEAAELFDSAKAVITEIYPETAEQLATELAALQTELGKIKSDFEAEGNAKPLTVDNYEKQLTALQGKIDNFTAKVTTARDDAQTKIDQHNASDKAYEALVPQLETLQARYYTVAEELKHYGSADSYASQMAVVDGMLQYAAEWLEKAKKDYNLDANSTIPGEADINRTLDRIEANATSNYTKGLVNDATAKVAEATAAVNTGTHANQATLEEGLADLVELLRDQRLMQTADPALVADVETIHDQIVADAEALIQSVKDNTVILGDANQDNDVTMTDYMAMLDFMLGEEGGTFDPTDKGQVASDINGDKQINVGDLTSLLNIILGYTPQQAKVMAYLPVQRGENIMQVVPVAQEGDVVRYAVVLNNANEMVNVQFDLTLANGQEVVAETVCERANMLDLHSSDLSDGSHRIILASPEISNINDNSGAVVYVDVRGKGHVGVTNAKGSNANATIFDITCEKSNQTMLDQIRDGIKAGIEKVYNVGGQLMRGLQRGVNIVRRADGSVEKVYNNDNE